MRPPIVLLLFDQLRADALGSYGGRGVRTPHLDRLAEDAARFETCITNAPLCRPARITLLTGQPVHVHGFDTNRGVPPTSIVSHVRALRDEAGYHTVAIGKTHLHNGSPGGRGGGHLDAHRGVLFELGFADARELPDAARHDVESAHSDWLRETSALGEDKLRRWRDHVAHHHLGAPPPDHAPWRLSTDDHLDRFCGRIAARYIRERAGDAPLYMQIGFPGPHPPFDPTSAYLDAIDPRALAPPIREPSTGPVSPIARRQRRRARRDTLEDARARCHAYHAKVSLIDDAVGDVLAALDETGLMDDAWIIATSDHGELLGDHGYTGKVLAYDASIRVPLIVRPPGGLRGGRVDRGAVDHLDVVATIRELASSPPGAHGASLRDRVLHGANAHMHKAVVFEAMGNVGVRTERATLSYDRALGVPVELFDRAADPRELHNALADESSARRVEELVAALQDVGAIGG